MTWSFLCLRSTKIKYWVITLRRATKGWFTNRLLPLLFPIRKTLKLIFCHPRRRNNVTNPRPSHWIWPGMPVPTTTTTKKTALLAVHLFLRVSFVRIISIWKKVSREMDQTQNDLPSPSYPQLSVYQSNRKQTRTVWQRAEHRKELMRAGVGQQCREGISLTT